MMVMMMTGLHNDICLDVVNLLFIHGRELSVHATTTNTTTTSTLPPLTFLSSVSLYTYIGWFILIHVPGYSSIAAVITRTLTPSIKQGPISSLASTVCLCGSLTHLTHWDLHTHTHSHSRTHSRFGRGGVSISTGSFMRLAIVWQSVRPLRPGNRTCLLCGSWKCLF